MTRLAIVVALILALPYPVAAGMGNYNFADRQAVAINDCPYIQLDKFSFANEFRDRDTRLITNLSWTNKSDKPIMAFEVVVLRYDPFNRPLSSGGSWLVPGKNSADWSPLNPGESSEDGMIGFREEHILTSVAFVRAVRLADGTVWMFDPAKIEAEIKKALPAIKEVGNVNPALPRADEKQK